MALSKWAIHIVTSTCQACRHTGVPHLARTKDKGALGAYCAECNEWLCWVAPQGAWLEVEAEQNGISSEEETWITNLCSMANACYASAEASGFHDKGGRSPLERCMLVVTELAELAEAARHGTLDAPSEHIPAHTQAAEEWADVLVRVFDHSHEDCTPEQLARAFVAKLAFNRTRGYRHGGKTI